MSIQLVLSHYLSGLREREELDALLPDLLMAMGHWVESSPQVGVNQGGVDVLSTLTDADGAVEAFLYVIKFGNVSRSDFYSGQQAIQPSVRQAASEYIQNRLPAKLRRCKKTIVIVSNGELKQDAQSDYAALTKEVAEINPLCSLDFWGINRLSPLIEQHLFDDALLLDRGKSDLRAALAGLEDTQASFSRFIRFVEDCVAAPEGAAEGSANTRKKRFLKRAAAAAMGWAVLLVWGQTENNQKPGVLAGEYLLLRLWSEAITLDVQQDKQFLKRFETLARLHLSALNRYYDRIFPSLLNLRRVLRYRPDHVLYMDLACEELGRLGTASLLAQAINAGESERALLHAQLISFISVHQGCRMPVYDGQAIDMSLAMAALFAKGDTANIRAVLGECVDRFSAALRERHFMPVDTDDLEDAMALHNGKEGHHGRFFKTTTWIPLLGTVAAMLDDQKSLHKLSTRIVPQLKGVTMERWYPSIGLQTLTGSRTALNTVGVSRAISEFRNTPEEEVSASLHLPPHSAAPNEFEWHNTPWDVLIAISARIHRHPLPTWYLQKCTASQATA
ncbi:MULTISPECIES: hypothetical protein [Pseudomonas]|nr:MULTISPECIES: hypothetical protein [Pseudomonas]MCF3157344.1 hypothetical protein [Pseudomonas juntendi]WAB95615.1 hypothetical protein OSW16_13595 [Pseudomonas putida]GLO56911.1 hypothetical protein PPUJ20066_29470 [Pseudomonas putida]HDS0927175.1 hypothetical protein [Pseudomonas putida]HEE9764563.1 hypothetical protein [Pseudomonas putida]